MRRILILILVLFAGPFGRTQEAAPAPEQEFLEGLDRVRTLLAQSKWKSASNRLTSLLDEHAGEDHAHARRMEIEEFARQCAFRLSYKPPRVESLISGELKLYSERSGRVKLHYTPDTMGDFMKREPEDPSSEEPVMYIHPAFFSGPHTIEIKGERYPILCQARTGCPQVILCSALNQGYSVVFGFQPYSGQWLPPRISRFDGKDWEKLAEGSETIVEANQPFELTVKISEKEIASYYGRKTILKVKEEAVYDGQFVFCNIPFSEILIEGIIQPAWLQGVLDKEIEKARVEFEKKYKAAEYLPGWLLSGPEEVASAQAGGGKIYPGPHYPAQFKHADKVLTLYNNADYRGGLDYVLKQPEGAFTPVARSYLLALFHRRLRKYDAALEHCGRVCKGDPGFLPGRIMKAFIHEDMRAWEKAGDEYRALLEAFPGQGRVYTSYASLLLRRSRPKEAKEVVDSALRNGIRSEEIHQMNELLVKALNGPNWSKMYDVKSEHYHIFSDISRLTCIEASRTLEESYRAYGIFLHEPADLETKRFRVYIFSGEAGYQAYCRGIEGDPTSTLGLYAHALRQLLIWNAPDRARMIETIRHEGFHQYLHNLVDDPPAWFDEGLAEYHELVHWTGGKWQVGQVSPYHLRVLKNPETRLTPLQDLLYLEYRPFYEDALVNYAQSWAFIHFLRHSTEENLALFKRIFEALLQDRSATEAMALVFDDEQELAELQRDFEAYIKEME